MHFSKILLIVASATLALAQDAIISKAVYSGQDTTHDDAWGSKIYAELDNLPTAAASLLVRAAVKSDYEPHGKRILKSIYPYQGMEDRLKRFKGFESRATSTRFELTGDRADLYEKVKKAYEGNAENKIIAATLRNLVPKTNDDTSLETWLLSVPVIRRKASGQVSIKLARLTLRLKTDVDGQVIIEHGQTAKFVVTEFDLNPKYLREYAEAIAESTSTVFIEGYKTFFTTIDAATATEEANNEDDKWFHVESPGQISLIERLRKAWLVLWE